MSTKPTQSTIQPYLFFGGRCEEAVEFYRTALGAEVEMIMRFKDSPEPPSPDCMPASPEAVMHASFRIGNSTVMASDGTGSEKTNFQGFALSLSCANESEADRLFAALKAGGEVQMPLTRTFWSPRFGMLTDRFGVAWMISVVPPEK